MIAAQTDAGPEGDDDGQIQAEELIAERQFQERRRISLGEVARGSGVHRATLSKVLNQHGYHASLDVVEKLCRYFGVEVGELLSFVERPPKKKGRAEKGK